MILGRQSPWHRKWSSREAGYRKSEWYSLGKRVGSGLAWVCWPKLLSWGCTPRRLLTKWLVSEFIYYTYSQSATARNFVFLHCFSQSPWLYGVIRSTWSHGAFSFFLNPFLFCLQIPWNFKGVRAVGLVIWGRVLAWILASPLLHRRYWQWVPPHLPPSPVHSPLQ